MGLAVTNEFADLKSVVAGGRAGVRHSEEGEVRWAGYVIPSDYSLSRFDVPVTRQRVCVADTKLYQTQQNTPIKCHSCVAKCRIGSG